VWQCAAGIISETSPTWCLRLCLERFVLNMCWTGIIMHAWMCATCRPRKRAGKRAYEKINTQPTFPVSEDLFTKANIWFAKEVRQPHWTINT
jgi:hypothetical protein